MFTLHSAARVPKPFLFPPGSQAMQLRVPARVLPPPPRREPSSLGPAPASVPSKNHLPDTPPPPPRDAAAGGGGLAGRPGSSGPFAGHLEVRSPCTHLPPLLMGSLAGPTGLRRPQCRAPSQPQHLLGECVSQRGRFSDPNGAGGAGPHPPIREPIPFQRHCTPPVPGRSLLSNPPSPRTARDF